MLKNLALILFVPFILCSEEIRKVLDNAKCKGQDLNVSEKDKGFIVDCSVELGIKSKNDFTPEKMPCFSMCIVQKQGLVDKDGTPHKEKILQMTADSKMPEEIKEEMKKLLSDCLDEHGPKAKADDKTCKSFEPLTTCIHKSFMRMCMHGQ